MAHFGGLWIGLSVFFGCLVLAVVVEVYYLLWRKNRIAAPPSPSTETTASPDRIHYAKELLHVLVHWRKPSPERQGLAEHPSSDQIHDSKEAGDPELGTAGKDVVAWQMGEESVESELMRIHNLSGPPRLLFTIKEESKEDLESSEGRSRKGSQARSLSDLVMSIDGSSVTQPQSPAGKPLVDSYNNLLFEMVWLPSSPPPTFKFLRDAEEKMYRRMKEEADAKLTEVEEITVPPAAVAEQAQKKMTDPVATYQVSPLVSSTTALRLTPEERAVCR
ncbi:hypothetical protein SAY86_002864 [Trapa natans]|uniref:Uncharacterized protein n=1 Tax=Trapa natans TaxID=22666 RepID=A0AAN7LRP1_TRANT|nr:hypothetical protein SAY86_002864 [Trapa natans]